MTLLSAVVAGLGIFTVLWRKTTLGMLIGFQLFMLSATVFWSLSGKANSQLDQAQVYGVLLVASSILPILLGLALSVRLFYLRRSHSLNEIKNLKH